MAGADKSGVKPQVISLPSGPGSIEGLGESFEPQLNSGTMHYGIGLKIPPGRAGFEPGLRLAYDGGMANGALGLGWTLPIPYIQRQTDKGFPEYDATDTFLESGGEELVDVGNGYYRHETEGAFVRYERAGAGWLAKGRSGVVSKYGLGVASQIRDGARVYRWLLEESEDTNGNVIRYEHASLDGTRQRYCTRIVYNENGTNRQEIVFEHESRQDALADYRPAFRLEMAMRCRSIAMRSNGRLVRRYDLRYVADRHVSLLESVTQVGADGTSFLPPARFTYTAFDPGAAQLVTMCGHAAGHGPPALIMSAEPDVALNDMNADALPDLLVAAAADHAVYVNQGVDSNGVHRWSAMTTMGAASPGEALGNDGASLADVDGDGKTDFIARRAADTFFVWPNVGSNTWGAAQTFADNSNLPFDFENAALRLVDANSDKHIDVMYCNDASGNTYSYMLNNGGMEFTNVLVRPGLGDAMTFDQEPGMKLADMNGDRLQDIVLLKDGECRYWPMAGIGAWDLTRRGAWGGEAGTGTKMSNAPDSEDDGEPGLFNDWSSLMLVDVNGDGLTDVTYVPEGTDRLVYWINSDSLVFEGPFAVSNLPVRVADTSVQPGDMNGNGATDILWNYPDGADVDAAKTWQYLEFCPAEKPYLLKTGGNGIGRLGTITYASSADYLVRDRAAGRPWPHGLPIPVNVVAQIDVFDGRLSTYTRRMAYHDGFYDGQEKEFRGFAAGEQRDIGNDASAPDLVMAYAFDTGAEQEAMKGKPLQVEARNAGGDVFYRETNAWAVTALAEGTNGDDRVVSFAHARQRTRDVLEKSAGIPVQLKWDYAYDAYGNLTNTLEHGRMDAGWEDERMISARYSADSASGRTNWILDRVVEQRVTSTNGTLVAHKRNYYDNLPLGEVARGNLTRTEDWVGDDDYVISARTDYDAHGNVIAIYDPLYDAAHVEKGHFREITYDDAWHTFPVRETVHTGNTNCPTLAVVAGYDAGWGVVLRSADFNGFTTHYGYDTFGRLVSTTIPPDTYATVEYDYILNHQLTNGTIVNWVETRKREDDAGGTLDSRLFYDGLGRTIMTRAEGEFPGQVVVTETLLFNGRKVPWKKYLPYFEEDSSLGFVEPTHNTGFTEHLYDALGREIRINQPVDTNGLAVFSTTTYEPLSRTLRDEEQTNTNSVHYGCGMRYVLDGLQDANGNGRLREVYEIVKLTDAGEPRVTPVEWKTTYRYDLLDNLVGYTDSQLNQKFIVYDGLSRKVFMDDPDCSYMWYAYDGAGNLIRTREARGLEIGYAYDGANRVVAEYFTTEQEEVGQALQPSNRWTVSVDTLPARPPDVAYHYDTPSGPLTRYQYWQAGPTDSVAIAILDSDGYDSNEDLNTDGNVDVSDLVRAARGTVSNDFIVADNTKGLLAWVRDLSGEEHTSYDERGRIKWGVKRILHIGSGQGSKTPRAGRAKPFPKWGARSTASDGRPMRNFFSSVRYDSKDRVTRLIYPDGTYVFYSYNSRGLLESVADVIDRYDYNPAGQNEFLELACGVQTTYQYDHRLRLSRILSVRKSDGLVLQNLNYVFDGVPNITGIRDDRSPADLNAIGAELGISTNEARKFNATQSFTYDSLYRLTRASNPAVFGTVNYRYDRIGNTVRKDAVLVDPDPPMDLGVIASGGTAGTFGRQGRSPSDPPGPHAVTETDSGTVEGITYHYDAMGNLTSYGGTNLKWNVRGRLTEISGPTESATYLYDYSDTRKRKVVTESAKTTTRAAYYVDRLSEVRRDQLAKFAYAGQQRVAASLSSGALGLRYRPSEYYLHDHLGSTMLALSTTGRPSEQTAYYAFGSRRVRRATATVLTNAYAFTGKEHDDESGLYYFEARYLSSALGRFICVDPILSTVPSRLLVTPQNLNAYLYARGNPVNYLDPTGRETLAEGIEQRSLQAAKEGRFLDTGFWSAAFAVNQMFNPMESFREAGRQADVAFDPGRTAGERLGAAAGTVGYSVQTVLDAVGIGTLIKSGAKALGKGTAKAAGPIVAGAPTPKQVETAVHQVQKGMARPPSKYYDFPVHYRGVEPPPIPRHVFDKNPYRLSRSDITPEYIKQRGVKQTWSWMDAESVRIPRSAEVDKQLNWVLTREGFVW